MTETSFGPLPPHLAARCAPTELEEQTGVHLKGIAHTFRELVFALGER